MGSEQTDLHRRWIGYLVTRLRVGVNDILIPEKVTIKAGDAVNFIIGGGHVLAVYDDGTKPKDIGQ